MFLECLTQMVQLTAHWLENVVFLVLKVMDLIADQHCPELVSLNVEFTKDPVLHEAVEVGEYIAFCAISADLCQDFVLLKQF